MRCRLMCTIRHHTIGQCVTLPLRLFNLKACFVIAATLFTFSIWHNNDNYYKEQFTSQDALHHAAIDAKYAELYRKSSRLPNDTKFLLLWTPIEYAPFYYMGRGQKAFIDRNCTMYNCYVTDDRHLFGGDLTKFHAIAFNGRNLKQYGRLKLPKHRAPHQKYIYFNTESADYYPVCNEIYENYFNWTSTYRLDSEIPFAYISIKDTSGRVVGPRRDMKWRTDMVFDNQLRGKLMNKSRVAAWFVSHCGSRSKRKAFVKRVQKYLSKRQLTIDIYGTCGTLTCPITDISKCNALLENDYMFYMSLENSFAQDYVTEKLLTALQHNVVPVVLGGANYSRFLPPGSYLDGVSMSPSRLAHTMARASMSPRLYSKYFKWKSYYTYHNPFTTDNICSVCEALNNKQMYDKFSVYNNFREWWHPNYKLRCKTT